MDVDEILTPSALPAAPVDVDAALAAATSRGRARRQRRRLVAGAAVVLLTAGTAVAAVAATGGADRQVVTAGTTAPVDSAPPPSSSSEPPPPSGPSPDPEPGDPAVWWTDPAAPPTPESTTFTAHVARLDCNSGITGTVLRPGVALTATEIVVTFTVETDGDGGTCPTNDRVPYDVDLGEPLGDRRLVDGGCAPGQHAATTSFCSEDEGIRWRPDTSPEGEQGDGAVVTSLALDDPLVTAVAGHMPDRAPVRSAERRQGVGNGPFDHIEISTVVDGRGYEMTLHRPFTTSEMEDGEMVEIVVPGGRAWLGDTAPDLTSIYYLDDTTGVGLRLAHVITGGQGRPALVEALLPIAQAVAGDDAVAAALQGR